MKTKHTSKEKLESKEIQTKKNKNVQKVHLKTSCKKSLGRLKENRKILFYVKAVLLVVPWVRVEFTIQIYLSLYFPFKIFIIILWLWKKIFNEKQREKDQANFPDNSHIMVLLVHPLMLMTALLQRETVRNKTKIKPTPKPTLTTKQKKILSEVMLPM